MKVEKITERTWRVESETTPGQYYIVWYDPIRDMWGCSCPSFRYRFKTRKFCKHIMEVIKCLKKQ